MLNHLGCLKNGLIKEETVFILKIFMKHGLLLKNGKQKSSVHVQQIEIEQFAARERKKRAP